MPVSDKLIGRTSQSWLGGLEGLYQVWSRENESLIFSWSDVKFGEIGTRDEKLSIKNVTLGGREGDIRFVHFPTDATSKFLLHAQEFKASALNTKIAATGGGAFKFEDKFQEVCKYDNFKSSAPRLVWLFLSLNLTHCDFHTCNSHDVFYLNDGMEL